jgi:hypothetical protein
MAGIAGACVMKHAVQPFGIYEVQGTNSRLGLPRPALDQHCRLADKGPGVRVLGPLIFPHHFLHARKASPGLLLVTELVLCHGHERQCCRMPLIGLRQRRKGLGVALLLKLAQAKLGDTEGDAIRLLSRAWSQAAFIWATANSHMKTLACGCRISGQAAS